MMKRCLAILLLTALATCAAADSDPAAASRLVGNWLSASGNVEVEIARCEPQDARLCGTITRVLSNQSMSGSGQSMGNHDDRGLRILTDFAPAGGDAFRGHILNRENGKVYDCIIRPGGPDEMVVRPYVLFPLFGQTQTWHRQH
jgi:uncharacterized protein (DUF2147 family)